MKFIALNQSTNKIPTVIQVNPEYITHFKITQIPGGQTTRVDLTSGEHIFVSETPTDILRIIQARMERID